MSGLHRPLPVADEDTEPFWQAAREGVLALPRCSACGAFALPPDIICPHCHSTDPGFTYTPVRGTGRIRSWTVVRSSFLSGFDLPFLLVDVQLDDQPEVRMVGRLLDGPDTRLQLGQRVELAWEHVTPDVAVPAFVLEVAR